MRRLTLVFFFFVAIFLLLSKSVSPVYAGVCGGGNGDTGCYTDSNNNPHCPGSDGYNSDWGQLCCQAITGTSCETGACFLPGTLLRQDYGAASKKIEDIKVGESVTSFNEETGNIIQSRVSNVYKVKRSFYYSLTAGDYKVSATAEHPFYIGHDEFKKISLLKPGDLIYVLQNDKLTPKFVISNIRINEPTDAYNLSVDKTETFFANDFAVHNKCLCGTYDAREDGGGAHACIPHPNPNDCIGAGVPDGCPPGQHLVQSTMPVCYGLIDINSLGLTPGAACSQQCRGDECWDNAWWVTIPTSICVPYPSCTTAAPSAPTLVSPANGATVTSTTVQLSWNPPTGWGAGCPENNNYYTVHMRPVGGTWSTYYDGITVTSVPVNGTNGTTYEWYIEANNGSLSANSVVGSFTIDVPPGAWWQVKDGDVAANGSLSSNVPSGNYFGLAPIGGYPGVPVYIGSASFTPGTVSQNPPFGWLADSPSLSAKVFDYQFFANQIPDDTVITDLPSNVLDGGTLASGGMLSHGYYWYRYTGTGLDLSLTTAANLGDRKVILLVDSADFLLGAPINLTKGEGFFMAIVGKNVGGSKGNIIVDPSLGGGGINLEGIYLASGQFKTGIAATQLYVRGSVAAYGGVVLERDLGGAGNTAPSEFFEYAPDQILLFPSKLGVRKINWKEVAP